MGGMRLTIEDGEDAKQALQDRAALRARRPVHADDHRRGCRQRRRHRHPRQRQLYDRFRLRRVYYSAFSPIPDASAVLPLSARR